MENEKRILRKWLTPESSRDLVQGHPHIDDPGFVIKQKVMEQRWREEKRDVRAGNDHIGFRHVRSAVMFPGF